MVKWIGGPCPPQRRHGLSWKSSFSGASRRARAEPWPDIWKQLLRVDQVGRHDNFFELGGDSILSIQMGARANRAGLRVTPNQIFQHQTIAELAKVAGIYEEVIAEQGVVTGPVPLTPIQHWFFEQRFVQPHHWNMAWVLEAPVPLLPEHMEKVVETLLVHHDALRLRLTQTDEGWQQKLGDPDGRSPFAYFDWSHLSASEAEKAWDLEAGRLQASLSFSDGPLIRVALIHFGSGRPDRVLPGDPPFGCRRGFLAHLIRRSANGLRSTSKGEADTAAAKDHFVQTLGGEPTRLCPFWCAKAGGELLAGGGEHPLRCLSPAMLPMGITPWHRPKR